MYSYYWCIHIIRHEEKPVGPSIIKDGEINMLDADEEGIGIGFIILNPIT